MTFGQRLKTLREEKTLSQVSLSKILNIANSTLSLYESDDRKPDYETLIKIAEYFNTSTDFLLGLTDKRDAAQADGRFIYSLDITGLPHEALQQISEYAEFIRDKYKPYKARKRKSD